MSYEGDTFYWEHLGMLTIPSYKERGIESGSGTKTTAMPGG